MVCWLVLTANWTQLRITGKGVSIEAVSRSVRFVDGARGIALIIEVGRYNLNVGSALHIWELNSVQTTEELAEQKLQAN